MTADPRLRLGPLGRRLLVAFVLVALSSVVVLTVAALVGTSRGLAAGEQAARDAAAQRVAAAAGRAYAAAGGWVGAELGEADRIATDAGSRLIVRDASGLIVIAPEGEAPGQVVIGQGSGRGAVVAP